MAQTTLRDYLQTTEDAISTGRVNDALANCQYILTHFPEALEAQRLLGEVYLAQGKLEEAQQTFDWVLTNDPENVMAYCNRALICERMSDYDTALDCYQQAYELSRGNSQIRQIFNQLSEKVGQQGFIFSRAGLARLYMRGDLLPQAAQEWDTVLVNTPVRLDARTGLLETYWREGLYDQVEHLARAILQEVPHCLKALLLLAHVTFAQDALQAQDLMRQAEALDPDQVMAQELFSDFIAHQPKDPFLKLMKKSSAIFPETSNGKHAATTTADTLEKLSPESNGMSSPSKSPSTFSDPLVRWSSLDNIIEPQQDYQTPNEAAPFGNWADNNSSDFSSWNTFVQQDSLSTQHKDAAQANTDTPEVDNWDVFGHLADASETEEPELETWQTLPEPTESHDQVHDNNNGQAQPPQPEQQPDWYHMDTFATSNPDPWSTSGDINPVTPSATWDVEDADANLPAPPAWLDMLTRGDRRQASEPMEPIQQQPTTTPADIQEPPVSQQDDQQTVSHEESTALAEEASPAEIQPSWREHTQANPPSSESSEDEGFFFGPEWLKSLGATSLEQSFPQETEQTPPPAPLVELAPTLQAEPTDLEPAANWSTPTIDPEPVANWSTPATDPRLPAVKASQTETPETKQKITVENWLEQATQKLNRPDQNVLTTLEELENELHSQGFKPLEPGTLSALAKEPSLSSALAQFGNLEAQLVDEEDQLQSPQPELSPTVSPIEQTWSDLLEPEPSTQTTEEPVVTRPTEQTLATSSHLDALSSLASSRFETQAVASRFSSEPVQQERAPVSNQAASAPSSPQSTAETPNASKPNTPYEFELEMTMRRPVVHLQPMQQPPSMQQPQGPGQGHSGEHASTNKSADRTLSYRERLIKGYQYQLAGSYDEAMQEYRIIIRNAPELLGEIVSNMRALLKIVPRYSAGYRVLGDAYMRQGEYLQAMEAYNKALNMAKKAKN
ncbi:MAG TPA: hypothetical protein DDW33_04800 [Ktedonobacter sp.]|jgi:tetratricopeptide (TPR) repeat protein|nr:hypothetical protein [Ktedonobacter sp.]HBE27509.1 hypothetical protein [Ktedonobacter sp.]